MRFLILFILYSSFSFGQNDSLTNFKYSDSIFIVGQTKKLGELHQSFSQPIGFGSYTKNDSIIDSLFVFLKSNPIVNIAIISHTNTRGNSEYNLLLSQKKANHIKYLLTEKGINSERIKSIGKGETEAIYSETEINFIDKNCFPNKFDQMHKANKRTIIKITS